MKFQFIFTKQSGKLQPMGWNWAAVIFFDFKFLTLGIGKLPYSTFNYRTANEPWNPCNPLVTAYSFCNDLLN
jgi:hypothetical protein